MENRDKPPKGRAFAGLLPLLMEGEEIVEKTENFKTFYTPVENRLLNVKKMYRTC